MTREEIKLAMSWIRPAIWAMFGRRPLQIVSYNLYDAGGHLGGWYEIIDTRNELEGRYSVKLEYGEVTYLDWRE